MSGIRRQPSSRIIAIVCGSAYLSFFLFASYLVQAQPVNDMFANRSMITGTNAVVTGSSVGATRETGEPYHAGMLGGASVWWSWTAPTNGVIAISTTGSAFDTVLGVYIGDSVYSLANVASNDDDPVSGTLTSRLSFDVAPGQTYQIAVDGYGGASGNVVLSVQFGPPQPLPLAPAWALPDPYGIMAYSSNFAGKVIILDFWATWCEPCKAEMPDFVFLQDKYRADGLIIIGADTASGGDTPQVVQSFLGTWTPTINYQIIMANSAIMQSYGGISAIPTTFIIDRKNQIRKQYIGTQSRIAFENQIIPLLYGNTYLSCQRSGSQMTLRWPTNALAFILECATNLATPAWIAWPTGPTEIDGTNTVPVSCSGAAQYFRLRMPY